MCGQYAAVAEAVVLVDKSNGMSKGSGFVFVNGKASAEAIIEGLHNKVTLEGAARPLRVDYATGEKDRLMALGFFGSAAAAAAAADDRVKLFVGNLSDGANHPWLASTFASTGVDVLEIVMVHDP